MQDDVISRIPLFYYIYTKLDKKIPKKDVQAVVSILMDEIAEDFINDKKLKIFNFMTILPLRIESKLKYNVWFKKQTKSKETRTLKVKIAKRFRDRLLNNFKSDFNG